MTPPPGAGGTRWELAAGVAIAAYFVSPWRSLFVDVGLMLAIAAAILWLPALRPPALPGDGPRGPWLAMLAGSLALALALAAWGWRVLGARPDAWLLGRTWVLYLPFAYLQQLATQRYLALRLAPPTGGGWRTSAAVALCFGVLHWPLPGLPLATALACLMWTRVYLATGRLWPLVLSHAGLAAVWFAFILDRDPFREGVRAVAGLGW